MYINIIKDIDQFRALQTRWDELVSSMPHATPFQTFEFNYYSWVYMLNINLNQLSVVAVYESDKVNWGKEMVIMPLYLDKKRHLRFINDKHSDVCMPIVHPEFNFKGLIKQVFNKLQKNFGALHLRNISSYQKLTNDILAGFVNHSAIQYQTLSTYVKLEKGDDIFKKLNWLKSKKKNDLKRITKHYSNTLHEMLTPTETDFPETSIKLLRDKMIKNGKRDSNFLDAGLMKLIKSLYRGGYVKIGLLSIGAQPLAITFYLIKENWALNWIDIYDVKKKKVNLANHLFTMNSLTKDKEFTISFGRGSYAYKNNFKPDVEILFELFYSPRKTKVLFFQLKSTMKIAAKKIIN